MAIFDKELDYNELIRYTDGTLQLGSFVQIRNALIKRFKEIYGNDIDINPASADGQYINSISLLINNIFQTIKKSYDSLDPASATGQFLDTICSFNNIFRIDYSASKVQLYIYNAKNTTASFSQLTFIDRNNMLWIWDNGGKNIDILPGEYKVITEVYCEQLGDINAPGTNKYYKTSIVDGEKVYEEVDTPAEQTWSDSDIYQTKGGTIYQTVNDSGLWVWQYSDAEIGNIKETDEALRSRRYQMVGNSSVTVLEGLKGSLLNIDGISDIYIFNNFKDTDTTLAPGTYDPIADGTTVNKHSIYIVLRYEEGFIIDENAIGNIIYKKLTPGISTSQFIESAGKPGESKNYKILRTSALEENIYWKKAGSVKPQITINFQINPKIYNIPLDPNDEDELYFEAHTATSPIEKKIVSKLQAFINKIKIYDYLNFSNVATVMQQSDEPKDGMSTFFVLNGYILDEDSQQVYNYPSNLNYFKYSDDDYQFEYDESGGVLTGTATLTIG